MIIVAVPVTPDGQVDQRWGKANQVAVADVVNGEVGSWQVFDTNWLRLHDEGHHGAHHARIVRFLREHNVEAVVINHAGAPMLNTVGKMGLTVVVNARGPAREAVLTAV